MSKHIIGLENQMRILSNPLQEYIYILCLLNYHQKLKKILLNAISK